MRHDITLRKISEQLNISISTVSRGLKNHPDISDSTRNRIQQLAAILDYEPNVHAVHLRTNTNKVLAVLVPSLADHFYSSCIAAIETGGRANGYSVIVLQCGNNPAEAINNLKTCRQRRVAGVFACLPPGYYYNDHYVNPDDFRLPVLFINQDPPNSSFRSVKIDYTAAATTLAEVFLRSRRNHILMLLGNKQDNAVIATETALTELFRKRILAKRYIPKAGMAVEASCLAALACLSGKIKPDAVFCMNDRLLGGCMKAIQQLGLAVPDEIAVSSIIEGQAPRLYHPEITHVTINGYQLGKLAFGSMMEQLSGGSAEQEILLDRTLFKGGSVPGYATYAV
jgi:LacI family transcriptional regulator